MTIKRLSSSEELNHALFVSLSRYESHPLQESSAFTSGSSFELRTHSNHLQSPDGPNAAGTATHTHIDTHLSASCIILSECARTHACTHTLPSDGISVLPYLNEEAHYGQTAAALNEQQGKLRRAARLNILLISPPFLQAQLLIHPVLLMSLIVCAANKAACPVSIKLLQQLRWASFPVSL